LIKTPLVKSKALSIFLRSLLGASILALIFLIFYVYHEGAWRDVLRYYRFFINPKQLKLFLASFGPYAAPVFILVQALQVVLAPVPGEVTGFVGGYFFGSVRGGIYSTIGLMLGSSVAFGIARTLGMKFVEKVVKKKYIEKFNFFITHKGLYIAFILFVIPGFPKDSLCYLLGLTHMRFLDFFLMNLIGRLPGTLMLTLQGSAVKNEKYFYFFVLTGISIILFFIFYLARELVLQGFSHIARSIFIFLKLRKIDKHLP
jgi:uncharacterized membrane protein YdjX (TVP38/TMEM64 family)